MDLLERFTMAKSRKYDENTLKGYCSDIKLYFKEYMDKKNINNIEEAIKSIDSLDVEDFIECNKYAKSSYNRKLSALTSFYDWIINYNLLGVKFNPFKKIDRYSDVQCEKKDILTKEELNTLIEETKINKSDRMFIFNSSRTRFLITLMSSTGMRIEEVLELKTNYIIPIKNNYMINIPKEITKGNYVRRVPICGVTKKYYEEYLKERNKIECDNDYLLVSNRGKKYNQKNARECIDKYVKRANINKHITNHSFRHLFRTMATMNNINESLLCCIGGWSRKKLGNQSNVYLHDDENLDEIKIKVCENII